MPTQTMWSLPTLLFSSFKCLCGMQAMSCCGIELRRRAFVAREACWKEDIPNEMVSEFGPQNFTTGTLRRTFPLLCASRTPAPPLARSLVVHALLLKMPCISHALTHRSVHPLHRPLDRHLPSSFVAATPHLRPKAIPMAHAAATYSAQHFQDLPTTCTA